jgi:hypothetical protein
MPPDESALVTNDNEKKGQVAVGAYILQMGDGNGGVVNVAPRRWGHLYERHAGPIDRRPRPFLALLDRDEEIATAKTALSVSRHVFLFGPAGSGKTSLLRSLAHLPESGLFPDGVVYLSAIEVGELGLEDVLQILFDAFHESRTIFKPTLAEIQTAMWNIKALILLDNLHFNREESSALLAAAPGCTFVLASLERILWGKGELIESGGLPPEEALDLFVLELNRSLGGQEQVEVQEICASLGGHPLRIVQIASLVREKRAEIDAIKAQLLKNAPDDVVLRTLLESSTGSQKVVISILAAAGGAAVPFQLLEDVSQSAELKSDLQILVSLGMVQAQDLKFNLAGGLSTAADPFLDLAAWEDRLIKYLVAWLAKRPAQALLENALGLLVKMIQKAEQKNRWRDVLRIGQGLENTLILSRRWRAWLEVLRLMLKAARALGNRKTEAWVLHQLGTRAACLGPDAQARGFLTQALEIRQAIGDRAGLGVTQNNLRVLFNVPLPVDVRPASPRRTVTMVAIGAGLFTVLFVLAAGMFLLSSNSPESLIPPTLTVTPSIPLTPGQTPLPRVLVDFVLQADMAIWESKETFDPDDNVFEDCDLTFGALPLPPCGFARWESTVLEDDSQRQDVLVVEPFHANGAQIQGTYDLRDIEVTKGDRLVTVVGFLKDAETLGLAFYVLFSTGDPGFLPVVVYATRDRNDGRLIEESTLLPDELAGQRGYFILQVSAAPNTTANWASWVVARLERP